MGAYQIIQLLVVEKTYSSHADYVSDNNWRVGSDGALSIFYCSFYQGLNFIFCVEYVFILVQKNDIHINENYFD